MTDEGRREPGDIGQAIGDAVRDQLAKEGELITSWVLVATGIDDAGHSFIRTHGDRDMASWTSIGMLEYALVRERARAVDAEDDTP